MASSKQTPTTTPNGRIEDRVHLAIVDTKRGGTWTATDAGTDLVGEGSTKQEAVRHFAELCERRMIDAQQNDG